MLTEILIILLILVLIYKFYPTNTQESYENCNPNSCNIDIYNIKKLSNPEKLYAHAKVECNNSMVNTCSIADNFIDQYNDTFYGSYNYFNNSSHGYFDPVDMINYNDIYQNTTVADIYDQITKN